MSTEQKGGETIKDIYAEVGDLLEKYSVERYSGRGDHEKAQSLLNQAAALSAKLLTQSPTEQQAQVLEDIETRIPRDVRWSLTDEVPFLKAIILQIVKVTKTQ